MTVKERTAVFLRGKRGKAYCDDCLADRLYLPDRAQARQAASALGKTAGFSRSKAPCTGCGKVKMVTQMP